MGAKRTLDQRGRNKRLWQKADIRSALLSVPLDWKRLHEAIKRHSFGVRLTVQNAFDNVRC